VIQIFILILVSVPKVCILLKTLYGLLSACKLFLLSCESDVSEPHIESRAGGRAHIDFSQLPGLDGEFPVVVNEAEVMRLMSASYADFARFLQSNAGDSGLVRIDGY